MRRKPNTKTPKEIYSLVFWIDTEEVSTVPYADLEKIIKRESLKCNWRGDLPWVDEFGFTELFEARILRFSKNKQFLDKAIVDCCGRYLPPSALLSPELIAEMKNIQKKKKAPGGLKKKSATKHENEVLHDLTDAFDLPLNDNNVPESNELRSENKGSEQQTVVKCTGLCTKLLGFITPEIVGYLEKFCVVLREELNQQPLIREPDVMISLGQGFTLKQSELKLALARGNGKKYDFMYELFKMLVPESDIKADSKPSDFPAARAAIISYVNSRNIKTIVSVKEFNRKVGDRLRHYRKTRFGEAAAVEEYKRKQRDSAKKSRDKKKKQKGESSEHNSNKRSLENESDSDGGEDDENDSVHDETEEILDQEKAAHVNSICNSNDKQALELQAINVKERGNKNSPKPGQEKQTAQLKKQKGGNCPPKKLTKLNSGNNSKDLGEEIEMECTWRLDSGDPLENVWTNYEGEENSNMPVGQAKLVMDEFKGASPVLEQPPVHSGGLSFNTGFSQNPILQAVNNTSVADFLQYLAVKQAEGAALQKANGAKQYTSLSPAAFTTPGYQ